MSVNFLSRAAGCLDPGFSAGLGPVHMCDGTGTR